jgi:hypothetical protein
MGIIDGGTATGLPAPSAGTGTTDIEQIFIAVNQQLQDTLAITYPYANLLPYLNLGIQEIINLKPDAYPVTENLDLVTGPIQALGTDQISIIDVICNMGTGSTVGGVIRSIDKMAMDNLLPDWMTHPTSTEVIFVVLDARDPKTFYTYPPVASNTLKLRAVVAEAADQLTAITDTFPLDASYKPATVDYIVYRALIEETTVPNAINKAQVFFNKFLQDLGLKQQVEQATEDKGQ